MPALTVDGRAIAVPGEGTVLQAVRLAGIHLPTLCHWEGLPPYGACRLCLVEVRPAGGSHSQVVASCSYPVEEALQVDTAGPSAVATRKLMVRY